MKVIIDRSKWSTGSLYKRRADSMCAMGFIGHAAGISKDKMDGYASPRGMREDKDSLKKWASVGVVTCSEGKPVFDNDFIDAVIKTNDGSLSDRDREHILKEIFCSKQIVLEFTGKLK